MSIARPKYVTFDCYGTLIWFRMGDMTRQLFARRVPPDRMDHFIRDFAAYRFDEVLGAWKPYAQVIAGALERTCRRWNVTFDGADAQRLYAAVPSWGPHPDVPEPLARVARHIPLVILSNASNDQIHVNVAKLGAPFQAVYTAEQAEAYKPRFRAFEYMLDQLGCGPEEVLHVSSSLRYDLMPASDLGIRHKVFVARGHDPGAPAYGYHDVRNLSGLPVIVGL